MPPRIVIVGANFAGLKAARTLAARADVTVIDQGASFEWLPNIHELVSGVKRAAELRLPRRRVIGSAGHRFVRGRVDAVEAPAGRVVLTNGRTLPFDACIVAVGGVHDTAGIPGADRFAMPFKNVPQCEAIRRRLHALAGAAAPLSAVIVGGGLEGIEALGEILRRYRRRRNLSITLVEAAPRLLPGAPAGLDTVLRRDCESLPVRFLTGARVTAVREREIVVAENGALPRRAADAPSNTLTIPFDVCIWSAGSTAPALLCNSHLAERPGSWAVVRPTLQSQRFENVFVAGDAAELPSRTSKQAYFALQMGENAARNAERLLHGRGLQDFQPSPKPMLVTFGDLDTFFVFGETVLAGTGLAAVKESVFQVTMAQLDPPTSSSALASLSQRLSRSLRRVLPAMFSPDQLLQLPRVRVVA